MSVLIPRTWWDTLIAFILCAQRDIRTTLQEPKFCKKGRAERLMHVMIKSLEGKYLTYYTKPLAKILCEEICMKFKIASVRLTLMSWQQEQFDFDARVFPEVVWCFGQLHYTIWNGSGRLEWTATGWIFNRYVECKVPPSGFGLCDSGVTDGWEVFRHLLYDVYEVFGWLVVMELLSNSKPDSDLLMKHILDGERRLS